MYHPPIITRFLISVFCSKIVSLVNISFGSIHSTGHSHAREPVERIIFSAVIFLVFSHLMFNVCSSIKLAKPCNTFGPWASIFSTVSSS